MPRLFTRYTKHPHIPTPRLHTGYTKPPHFQTSSITYQIHEVIIFKLVGYLPDTRSLLIFKLLGYSLVTRSLLIFKHPQLLTRDTKPPHLPTPRLIIPDTPSLLIFKLLGYLPDTRSLLIFKLLLSLNDLVKDVDLLLGQPREVGGGGFHGTHPSRGGWVAGANRLRLKIFPKKLNVNVNNNSRC